MVYKYINTSIAFFMLAGATATAVFGKNPETLSEMAVRGSNNFEDLDLSRASILGGNSLETRQVNSLGDLNGLSPNLHLSGNGIKSFGDVISMRGIGNTPFFSSPGVQLYVDGVPQGNVFSYGSDLYDLEAIEVLKGPQGSRFGKLAPGGAINLITKKPGDMHTSELSASYATFNTQKYNISSSGPIDEQFSYSLGIQRSSSDGFLNNTSGRDNDSETWNGRLSFHWDGGAGTKAILGTSFTSHELGAQPLVLRNQVDFYARSVDEDEFTEIDQNQQFLKLEHETELGTITSVTSMNNWDMNPNKLDIDLSTNPGATSNIQQEQNNWGQELILSSNTEDSLSWVLGSNFYSNDISGLATRWYVFPWSENTLVNDLGPTATLTKNANFGNTTETTTYSIEGENFAIFTSFEKEISTKNSLEIGLRYDHTKSKLIRNKLSKIAAFTFEQAINPNLPGDIPSPETDIPSTPLRLSKNTSLFSPSVQLNHSINETSNAYIKFSNSGKPGGFSAFTDSESNASYEKEKCTTYEIGFNFNPTKNWLIKFSGFINNVDDYQMEMPEPASTNYSLVNVDEVVIQGIELETALTLSGGWNFHLGYGLSDSEINEVSDLASKSSALTSLKGKSISFVPQYTFSTLISHNLDNGLYYQIGTRTFGESFYWDQTGSNNSDRIEDYTLLDASIGYTLNDWSFNIFGTNLTDEGYYSSLVSSLSNLGAAPGIAGPPRLIGISVSRDF
jgi:iron complex outermembrane receptor protein